MSPEGGRQQYQEGKYLQAAHEHSEAKNQFAWFADGAIVIGDFAQPRSEIIHGGHYGGERGDEVEVGCQQG